MMYSFRHHQRRSWAYFRRPAPLGSNFQCTGNVSRCHFSNRRRIKRGQGGTSEEYYIAQAVRLIKETMNRPHLVVEVMNACNVGVTHKLFDAVPPSTIPLQNAPVLMRILTRADFLSDEALLFQMKQAEVQHEQCGKNMNKRKIAVMALNLRNAHELKAKSLRQVVNALLGGAKLAATTHPNDNASNTALVCGAPNAGKSSFILPITKHRTMKVKKKKGHHLPKISKTAGWTLSTKKHVLEVGNKESITLIDTPGMRPRLKHVQNDIDSKALLISCGAMKPTKGMMDDELSRAIVEVILKALNRHGSFVKDMFYVKALGLKAPTEDPTEFFEAFAATSNLDGAGVVHDLVRKCQAGQLGGMLFEDKSEIANGSSAVSRNHSDSLVINRSSPIVCMNDEARRWIDIGTGAAISNIEKDSECPSNHFNRGRTSPETSMAKSERKQSLRKAEIVCLPESKQELRCMICAGFIKRTSQNTQTEFCGKRHDRCINWKEHDIRSYYSRMLEAFEGRWSGKGKSHKSYLMKDSLACTFAAKYKLTSRRKAYKKLGKSLGGFPVSNEERPRRFQSDRPVPLKFKCTSSAKTSCRYKSMEGDER